MDVEVHGGGEGGVAEDNGDGLVIAFAFYATAGESVAQGVEADALYAKVTQYPVEVIPQVARLHRPGRVGHHEVLPRHKLAQRTNQLHESG